MLQIPEAPVIPVPIPSTLIEVTWFLLGIAFGRAFGKQLDQDIQSGEWFKKRSRLQQWVIARTLDFTHHWWIGVLLVLYVPYTEAIWFGWGLFVDDMPDVPRRYGKIIQKLRTGIP